MTVLINRLQIQRYPTTHFLYKIQVRHSPLLRSIHSPTSCELIRIGAFKQIGLIGISLQSGLLRNIVRIRGIKWILHLSAF